MVKKKGIVTDESMASLSLQFYMLSVTRCANSPLIVMCQELIQLQVLPGPRVSVYLSVGIYKKGRPQEAQSVNSHNLPYH